jgi:hypothetical protein
MKLKNNHSVLFCGLFMVCLTMFGCQSFTGSNSNPTTQSMVDSFAKTATVRAQPGSGLPLTETSETNLDNPVQSVTPQTTYPDQTPSTLAAALTLDQVLDELPAYHIDPVIGRLGWLHPSTSLSTDQPGQAIFRFEFPTIHGQNFVLAADITIESTDSASGCGFSLRVHGEPSVLSQYIVMFTRQPFGHLQFTALSSGEPANLRDIYFADQDATFSWENAATNHLAVIAQGNNLTLYSNHSRLGTIDISSPPRAEQNLPPTPASPLPDASPQEVEQYQEVQAAYDEVVQTLNIRYREIEQTFLATSPLFTQGYMGFVAVNNTGSTICSFDRAWLWILDP